MQFTRRLFPEIGVIRYFHGWCPLSSSRRAIVLSGFVSLCVMFLSACGGSSSTTFQQQPVTVNIATAPTNIGLGANWQYSATVSGSTNQSVTWTASAGSIDSTGLFIAPTNVPNPAAVTITAQAAADSSATKSTTITVQANDPLGSISNVTPLNSCAGSLQNGTCYSMTVSCQGASDITAYLKVLTPNGAPIGTVLFGVGTGGSGLYDDPNGGGYTDGSNVVQSIQLAGYNTVQVSFGAPFTSTQPNGWLQGPGGVRRVACRYATVADWVYHNPTTINHGVSVSNSSPMCATGNSGGSAAIAYAIYEYGLNTEFAMVEPTSGPVMSRIDQGCSPCSSSVEGPVCSGGNNQPQLCYQSADASVIDEAYQATGSSTPTPCTNALNGNPASNASALFLSDSILYNGPQTVPIAHTSIKQLFGDTDTSNAVAEGMIWNEEISPIPPLQCLASVQHDIPSFATGAQQIINDITSACH